MKKRIRIFLLAAAGAVLLAGSAGAEGAAAADEYVPKRIPLSDTNLNPVKMEQENGNVEYEAIFAGGTLAELEVELETGDVEYEVKYDAAGNITSAEYETAAGEITYDGTAWHNSAGEPVEGPDLSFMKEYYDGYKLKHANYPHNTMGVLGLSLRDLFPQLTKKWYHVLPVDLTKEGVFRFPTIVSNMFYMGYCEVTIQDGKVTVDYAIPYGTFYPEEQCFAWFTDIGDITSEFLNNPQSDFRYGEPVDIRETLKGQDTALLFMCNRVSYQIPLQGGSYVFPARFVPTNTRVRAMREEMLQMLEAMGSQAE